MATFKPLSLHTMCVCDVCLCKQEYIGTHVIYFLYILIQVILIYIKHTHTHDPLGFQKFWHPHE